MRYRTGDIAKLMGMTNMGVLYLEKRGIIRPCRQENGYRFYDPEDITKLGMIRSYEWLGFSLEEALTIAALPNEAVRQRLKEREREILGQLDMLRFMERSMAPAPSPEVGRMGETGELVRMPAMYYFPVWEDSLEESPLPPETERQLRQTDISWLAAMPYMRYCSKITCVDGRWHMERGNCIQVEHARAQKVVCNEQTEYVPPQPCLRLYAEGSDPMEMAEVGAQALEKRGEVWTGTAYAPVNLGYGEERTIRSAWVYLPVKRDKKQ